MAKHRSKESRIRAEKHRLSRLEVAQPFVSKKINGVVEKTVKKEGNIENIFTYDPKLIIKDLKKTIALVIFILLILLAIALIYT